MGWVENNLFFPLLKIGDRNYIANMMMNIGFEVIENREVQGFI